MNNEVKGQIIGRIVATLRFVAEEQGKQFCEGDTFFSLCFKTDDELLKIVKLSGA